MSSSLEDPRVRVLIIDDNAADRYLFHEYLTSTSPHYEVHEASNGQMGLALAHRLRPDCILLDLRLGGESGYEILEKLVGLERPSKIPVIILTELAWKPLDDGARCLGASDFLVKRKAEAATLDIAIRRAIDQRQRDQGKAIHD